MSNLYNLDIANQYGNVDVRSGVPESYTWIKGKRLQPLCQKHSILFCEAMTGFKRSGGRWQAQHDGVVVHDEDAELLRILIEDRRYRRHSRGRAFLPAAKAALAQAKPRLRQRMDDRQRAVAQQEREWRRGQRRYREEMDEFWRETMRQMEARPRMTCERVNWLKEGF